MGKNIYDELQNMKKEEHIDDSLPIEEEKNALELNIEPQNNSDSNIVQENENEATKEPTELKEQIKEIVNLENEKVKDIQQNNKANVSEIEISKLVPYGNQPFEEYTTEEKERMKKSIKINGIIFPIIVRPINNGQYQILAGHNRVNCATELDMETVPCIIKDVDDDLAKLIMVETNLVKRENISVMSKAKAYKIQSDIYKKKNLKIKNDGEKIAKEDRVSNKLSDKNLSYRAIMYLIKLNDLIEELQELVNSNKIQIKVASQIALLGKNTQKKLYALIKEKKAKFNEKQIIQIKEKEAEEGSNAITLEYISSIIAKKEKISITVTFSNEEIKMYFNGVSNSEELKKTILEIFEKERRR